jgi:hypothetical protein
MKFIRSKPIIALFITECCNLFGLFFFYTNVGKILTEIHHVPTQYAGYLLAGGFIFMPISCVGSGKRKTRYFDLKFYSTFHIKGIIADRLVQGKKMTLTNVRKLFNSLASFIPAGCMIVLCFCDETRQTIGVITILIFLIASGKLNIYSSFIIISIKSKKKFIKYMNCILAMAYGSGYIVNFVDVMPAYSSIVFGIITAAATFGALMANVIAGIIIKRPILEDWRKLFIIFAVIYFIGGVVYIILGSAVPRKWATSKAQENRINDKIQEEEAIPMQIPEANKLSET